MANDPGLTDTCIYLNDGPPAYWWMSPDISLTGPLSGADKADPNPNNNAVTITARRNASCALSPSVGVIMVDVYIGDPNLVMTPSSTTKITNSAGRPDVYFDPSLLPSGGSHPAPFNWVIPTTPGASETPGHKCLIARVYPDNNTPSPSNFFVPDDPHVVQRNICIVPCGGGGGGNRRAGDAVGDNGCGFDLKTVNQDVDAEQEVIIRAEADLQPTKAVLDILLPLLEAQPGFRQIAHEAPAQFSLHLPEFPDARVTDNTHLGCLYSVLGLLGIKGRPSYEAQVKLKGGQQTPIAFNLNYLKAGTGDAHVFHLTQIGPNGKVQGGLTLVFVLV